MANEIRYGMVGGSRKALIGDVHRKAINFDHKATLVAGCFSRNEELNRETAFDYGLKSDRIYADYESMARSEALREDGIDFVVITTPNESHYRIAKAFLEAGIHVFCEKPLCFDVEQGRLLKELAKKKGLLFGVAYTYIGYTMSKVMREMISEGKIGRIIAVNAEYAQDWLMNELVSEQKSDMKLAIWRTDPSYSGISNCVGDIGTHIESYVSYVTGLRIKRLMATVDRYGNKLEMNANVILEYDNGAHGAYWCSQIAAGHKNGLVVRIFGDKGSLEWMQEVPDILRYTPKGEAMRCISRSSEAVTEKSGALGRIPSGHPEGLYVAFANHYREYISAIEAHKKNNSTERFDFPDIDMGIKGVEFIHAVIQSADNDGCWIEMDQ